MRLFSRVVFALSFMFWPFMAEARCVIDIKNQNDFNDLQQQLIQAISNGEVSIMIRLHPGTYVYTENFVVIEGVNNPLLNIRIEGDRAIVVPDGKYYHNGDSYQGVFSTSNSWLNGDQDITIWSNVFFSDKLVEVVSIDDKYCRIHSSTSLSNEDSCKNAFIMIPHWFRTGVYKVDKVKDGYIYFTATDLAKSSLREGFNINDDYNYHTVYPRYKLCNLGELTNRVSILDGKVYLPKSVTEVYEGRATRFLAFKNSIINALEISGVKFRGSRFTSYVSFLSFDNVDAKRVRVIECEFRGLRSNIVSLIETSNVRFENCLFEDCYSYGIVADNQSENTQIIGSTFRMMGKGMQNTFSVICGGKNYLIQNNLFQDFGYGGIGVGSWHGVQQTKESCGIVENNHLYYTENYQDAIMEHTIMDGGAIYAWTLNDGAIIRNNYIHNISGAGDNRGIFCDDGARNITIKNNIITNIANSYCIDSRRVSYIENKVGPTNIGIIISNNIIGGAVRFEGRESEGNSCEYSQNYFLTVSGTKNSPSNIIRNVIIESDNVSLVCTGEKKGKIGLSSSSYKQIKRDPAWKTMKRYVIKKNK